GEMFGSDGSDPYGSSPYMATSATTLADLESFLAGAGDGFSADASTDAPFSTDSSRAAGTAWCQCMEGEQNALEQHNLQHFSSGELSDVELHAFGETWQLHRFCLVRSPFFRSMFLGDWVEAAKKDITLESEKLQGLSRDGLHHALEFLYCARLQPKSLDEFSEALLALKFLLMDEAVTQLLAKLERTLDCKDYGRVSSTAVLCKDGIPGLWQLTLAILAYHPLAVMDNVNDIHPEVLVGLVGHPGLRIRKDLSRYYLAEHILTEMTESQSSPKRPRRSTDDGQKARKYALAERLFATLPEWRLTEEDIKQIRAKGLVPDRLIVDWFLHPLRKYPISESLGYDVTISDQEVLVSVPESWRRLGNERIDPRPVLNTEGCAEPPIFFRVAGYYDSDDRRLFCHVRSSLADDKITFCTLRVCTPQGTVSDATKPSYPFSSIFRNGDFEMGSVPLPPGHHHKFFIVVGVPRKWGLGSYSRTTRSSFILESPY
ncbi:Germ cell-less protein-like 2 (Germ cell-less protein-like 1-like), partial [Durusdinium trenchii]